MIVPAQSRAADDRDLTPEKEEAEGWARLGEELFLALTTTLTRSTTNWGNGCSSIKTRMRGSSPEHTNSR